MIGITMNCIGDKNPILLEKEAKPAADDAALPLLCRAARAGTYGQHRAFAAGSISDALFVYLDGAPEPESIRAVQESYRDRPLVCLSDAWEQYVREHHTDAQVYRRTRMKPAALFRYNAVNPLPADYRVAVFDEAAFARHPFSHGENYPSFAAFQKSGSGAVVWHGGEIVSSASSFLTYANEVELDVSTVEAERGKGLASACIATMLQDCEARGISVHWDAQNETSAHLAEKFGFQREADYFVYWLPGEI